MEHGSLDLELILLGMLTAQPEWSKHVQHNWFATSTIRDAVLDIQAGRTKANSCGGLKVLLEKCGVETSELTDVKSVRTAIVKRVKLNSAEYRMRRLLYECLGTSYESETASNAAKTKFVEAVRQVADECLNGK